MIKSIIKELGILLLLLIAIAFLLAIIFYDYNPLNKTIPKKVEEYTLPEDVQKELNSTLSEEEKIVKTYKLDDVDLNKFKKEDEYNAGKIDPYSLDSKPVTGNTSTNSTSNTASTGSSNGVFFNTPGK